MPVIIAFSLGICLGTTIPGKTNWMSDHFKDVLGVVVFFVGIYTYVDQMGRSRFAHKTDTMFKLREQFSGKGMLKARAGAARHLIANDKGHDQNVDEVMDFFEDVAFLLRRDAIDVESVWQYFSYWSEAYWQAALYYRMEKRRNGHLQDEVWVEQDALRECIKRFKPVAEMSSEALQRFLKDETEVDQHVADNASDGK